MKISRNSWHYKVAHFASSKLEQEIYTRGGYYERVVLGIISLICLITLVVATVLGPILLVMTHTGYTSVDDISLPVLLIGGLGLFFDAIIIGGTFIFVCVISLSAFHAGVISPISTLLNKRQGHGILSHYLPSLSNRVEYEDSENVMDVD